MFDRDTIKTNFASLAGLRQNDNPAFGLLSPAILYVPGTNTQIQHPLVNIENLDACARNYGKYVFPAWSNVTAYVVGDRVAIGGINYEALVDNTGVVPNSDPATWKVLNLLDLFLIDVWNSAAEDVVQEVFLQKRIDAQVKTLLSSQRFYEGAGNMTNTIVNEGDLRGVMIKLRYTENILVKIEKIGLQLTAAQADLKLYLYHSSQKEKVATITINHTKVNSFEWHASTINLNYMADAHAPGGVFFLMYDQDELTGQAISMTHNFHLPPCGTCSAENVRAFNLYSKYFEMRSCKVRAADRDGQDLWDITKTIATPDTNNGLNFQATVRCDLTDFLVRNKDAFQYAFRDLLTQRLLEVMASTTRGNIAQTKADILARNELIASHAGGGGFKEQVARQMKGVNFEISQLNDVCIPCGKKGGIGIGTIGLAN